MKRAFRQDIIRHKRVINSPLKKQLYVTNVTNLTEENSISVDHDTYHDI